MIRPLAALMLAGVGLWLAPVRAAEEIELPRIKWSFSGPFDRFDRNAARRGFEVYTQACQFCHGLRFLSFNSLAALGFDESELSAIAAAREVLDGPNDDGDMFKRPARVSDRMPPPFANEKAARAANNGALPPDLSLMIKARNGGPDYVFGILTGYDKAPQGFAVAPGLNYNRVFPGHQIAMPRPLSAGAVTFTDGTPASVEQAAHDVVTFLAWASEPTLEERKRVGTRVLLFLLTFAALVFAIQQRLWARLH
ncbi:MAG: cytochrome c1 [Alphaproteobacteria bacterium]|nr:cytochrome c1 [Alphaproteobacteria bacterium]